MPRFLRCAFRLFCPLLFAGSLFCFAESQTADTVKVHITNHLATIGNQWITAQIENSGDRIHQLRVTDNQSSRAIQFPELFTIALKDGSSWRSSQLKVLSPLKDRILTPAPDASRFSDRVPGHEICTQLADEKESVRIDWCGILREGSNYFRQQISIHAESQDLPITEIRLLEWSSPSATVAGTVAGSPIEDGNFFLGFEHPLSTSQAKDGVAASYLKRILPLRSGQSITYSAVVGATPAGQMRRAFLNYVERERAHPYRTFLHYNTWYDLGYGNRFDEAGALDRIHAFGEELVRKRHVTMDSFLFDDGWDNWDSLYGFDSGFPQGFSRVRQAAAGYHFGIGVWLSPWGGYDVAKQHRLEVGRKEGYEIFKNGFALSGPKYYKHFEDICLEMISKYGVNQFKFDGTGNADQVFPGSTFDSDFDAAIHLIERLRQQKPDIFINLTTGTAPSPFWLRYADSIWRGGDDHSFAGVGSWRQKWITYHDTQIYKNIVQRGPLFPINSLMLHGVLYAKSAQNLTTDPENDFPSEVHAYFGEGTQLQEMYITPSLLTKQDWDVLAEAARWSRANASILKDTHWIGGNPEELQPYGWASWTTEKGILVLRNPSDHPQNFSLDIQKAFELPNGAPQKYRAQSPWQSDAGVPSMTLAAGEIKTISLRPFQVITLECTPQR